MKSRRELLIDAIRRRLARRAAALSHAVEAEAEGLAGETDEHHLADVDDLAGDAGTDEPLARLVEHGTDELEQLRWALARIDEGRFGVCEECQEAIHDDRLAALPTATRCLPCQAQADREPAEGDETPEQAVRRERRLATIEDVLERADRDDDEPTARAS